MIWFAITNSGMGGGSDRALPVLLSTRAISLPATLFVPLGTHAIFHKYLTTRHHVTCDRQTAIKCISYALVADGSSRSQHAEPKTFFLQLNPAGHSLTMTIFLSCLRVLETIREHYLCVR